MKGKRGSNLKLVDTFVTKHGSNEDRNLYQQDYYKRKLKILHPYTRELVEQGIIGLMFAYNLSQMKDTKLRKHLEYLLKSWFRGNNLNLVLYKLLNLIRDRSNAYVIDVANNIITGKAVVHPIEPCKTLGVCPYGALVKEFELDYSKSGCPIYHRMCPYFHVAVPIPIKQQIL